jgi:hypothetical protein
MTIGLPRGLTVQFRQSRLEARERASRRVNDFQDIFFSLLIIPVIRSCLSGVSESRMSRHADRVSSA